MIKSRHIIRLVTIQAALCLLFSISSYADGYSFSVDGDQQNKRFSGTNKVYTDGIYVGEMGAIDAYMDNYGNTYNGTNIIDATAYPGAGQDDESTYNGTLSVTANDIISSKTTVDDATVNAATTVTVNEVLADNNLNAGVQFNNSSFNNDVTLSGSGAVNLEGSTVNNLVLGNIPQMQTLLDYTSILPILYDNICSPWFSSSSSTRNFSFSGKSYSYNLHRMEIDGTNYYYNFSGFLEYALNNLIFHITRLYNGNATGQESKNYIINNFNGIPVMLSRFVYRQFSYDSSNDVININLTYKFNTYLSALRNIIDITIRSYIEAHVAYMADTWYKWYSPNISASDSQFWIAYNTDTEEYDHVNLSTVFGYITWYLGQLYIQGNEAASDISQSVTDLSDTLTDFETKEGQINSSIKSSLDTVDSFFDLPVITGAGTVIGWLQYMWVSLAEYQAITIIAWALVILTIVTGFYKVKRITV